MLREICDVFKEAYRRGWITTRDGNASFRRPEQDWFYVTPSGVRKNELVPDMCIKLDINDQGWSRDRWLNSDEGMLKQQLNRGLKPTGELPMHWYLQRDLSQTTHPRVVLHLHPTHVIAATRYLMERPQDRYDRSEAMMELAAQFPEIFRYTKVGKILGYVAPISQALADGIEQIMLNGGNELLCDVVAMDKHGAVSVGTDPWEAFEHQERLDHICQIFLLSR
jgi:ribulose-5-phosphate 4-epimerase/fuculose-1-phosphate aldolase